MDMKLAGKTALVTGASSVGLGRAIALGLAREGVKVAITARRGSMPTGTVADDRRRRSRRGDTRRGGRRRPICGWTGDGGCSDQMSDRGRRRTDA